MVAAGMDRPLIERERDLARLAELLERATACSGTAAVVQGPAGIGKTALLDAVSDAGCSAGATCLRAAGPSSSGTLPSGWRASCSNATSGPWPTPSARCSWRALRAWPGPSCSTPIPRRPRADAAHAAMHGLYWLAAGLAARHPLVLVVDDVHWADSASLRWLRTSPAAWTASRCCSSPPAGTPGRAPTPCSSAT
jgi:hypothetical protein